MKKLFGILFILTVYFNSLSAQEKLVDRIIATVGSAHISQSDLELEYTQFLAQGNKPDDKVKCYILQQLLTQKLLAQQAVIDSIEVSESEVDDQLNFRIRSMVQRAGGKERLEEFLNRSILQHKEELRPAVAEQLKGNKMQGQIVSKIDVTPEEVKRYFNSLDADSLPYFNTEIEYAQLVINPVLTKEEKDIFRNKAEGYRQQVLNGSDFGTIARLYSEDGSAPYGGELGFNTRENWVKEFSAQAFRLKKGEISPVFETQFGFHFLQVLERRGEEVNVRHILVKKQPTNESLNRAKAKIDSIADLIATKKLNFNQAASIYSDDQNTKYAGGVVSNMEDRSTLIPMDQLEDVEVFNALDPLQVGDISKPLLYTDKRMNEKSYRIYFLKSRIPPHKANMEQDFAKIKEAARQDKINRKLSEWFESRRETTYIDINPEFMSCEELKIWTKPTKELASK
ncbi:periplasmic chaperone for outer membrane proteins SurA [Sphingobacterium alimentarium]|uniref:Periplasmic chaperone for outer membrane proteins SurA n=1 Tax=Sphingobacterium alimentarium TaxID=797292 RepID=A0A4R3VX26_9SPHI|nr:peptidylprolyl isomerase [Sphingobacterium alimentarium]TCV20724.1 periplasmic chaperone for outer membrane proteins SurA [Sphingobacterium alimentarium]